MSLALDLDDLPADQAATIQRLLDEAHFPTLTENLSARPVPDAFVYMITVEAEEGTHTVHTSDTTMTGELRLLVDELSKRSRL